MVIGGVRFRRFHHDYLLVKAILKCGLDSGKNVWVLMFVVIDNNGAEDKGLLVML